MAERPDVVTDAEPTTTVSAVPAAFAMSEEKLPARTDKPTDTEQSEPVSNEMDPEPFEMNSLNVTLMLLVTDTPVASFSGLTDERVGATESIVIDSAEDLEDVFPAASACTFVISHTPSASDGKVHVEPEVFPDI